MAMHGAVFLASENEKLRAVNERQKKKRNQGRSSIGKGGILTVAEAQKRMHKPEASQNPAPAQGGAEGKRGRLPSCYLCYAFDHVAAECPGQQ